MIAIGRPRLETENEKIVMVQVKIHYSGLMQLLINANHVEVQEYVRPVMGKAGLTIDFQGLANCRFGIAV